MVSSRRAWLWCIPILLTAFWLMLRLTQITHMHHDEQLVYHFTRFDLGYTVWYLGNQDVHPPLWFSFFWLWRQFVGVTELTGRLQAILFSLITLALTGRIGRDWFGRPRFGLLAMLALSVNAYFLLYALEIRPYALSMLLATISTGVLQRWLRTGRWRAGLLYGVLVAVMFYVHYFLAFLVATHAIYGLVYIYSNRRSSHSFQKLLRQAGAAVAVAFVLWLPWLPTFLQQNATLRRLAAEAGNAYGAGIGTPVTTQFTNLQTIANLIALSTNGQAAVYAIVLGAGAFYSWRRKTYWLALLWAFGVPVLALLVNLVAAVYNPRYVAYLTVGLALALGIGLAALTYMGTAGVVLRAHSRAPLPERKTYDQEIKQGIQKSFEKVVPALIPRPLLPQGEGLSPPRPEGEGLRVRASQMGSQWAKLRPLFGIIISLAFFAVSLLALPNSVPVRIPYRDIFREMSAQEQPGDVVYFRDGGETDNLVQWNTQLYLSPTFTVVTDYDLDTAEGSRRVWFLTGDLFDESVERDFAALERTHPVQTVIGQCDRGWCYVAQLMEAPPWTEPVGFSDADAGYELPFWGADIDRADETMIETRLWWRVEQTPTLDYSFGLQLLDSNGTLVAQNDGPIQHYGVETVQTSNLQPGRIYIDFRNLALPDDLPPGVYALTLAVYRSWDNVRLSLPDGADRLQLEIIRIR